MTRRDIRLQHDRGRLITSKLGDIKDTRRDAAAREARTDRKLVHQQKSRTVGEQLRCRPARSGIRVMAHSPFDNAICSRETRDRKRIVSVLSVLFIPRRHRARARKLSIAARISLIPRFLSARFYSCSSFYGAILARVAFECK